MVLDKEAFSKFFEPDSVAVIGASSKRGKIGFEILKNIVEGGFKGEIYPVNPKAEEILGLKCYKSLNEINKEVDLAVIITPAPTVPGLVKKCSEKGVKAIIIISAGFSEVGNFRLEKELKKEIKEANVRVIGPNCAGLINTEKNFYPTMELRVGKGDISFVTQSGALGGAMLAWAESEGLGINKFVSYGNAVDVTETDVLEYLREDPYTKVIILYVEGVKNGRKFIETARKVSLKKPIVGFKGGLTEKGAEAVHSHTGSLAGKEKIYLVAFKQSGVILARDLYDLFDFSRVLSIYRCSEGDKIVILTNSGGPAVIATDKLTELGLNLPEPPPRIMDKLSFLPEHCSKGNPVDLTASGDPETYAKTLEALFSEDYYNAGLVICVPTYFLNSVEVAKKIIKVCKGIDKPLVTCFMSGKLVKDALPLLEENKIPNYPTPERAAKALWALVERGRFLKKVKSWSEPV